MSNVAIEKIHDPETAAMSLLSEMDRMASAIRNRAFEHFIERGSIFGSDVDDWLCAERELIWSPGAEMTEGDNDFTLRVQAPGFEAREIKITATPDSVLIEAEASHKHEESDGKIHLCEFARKLFRRLDLPSAINVDKVSATLDKGVLQIVAAKAQGGQKGRAPVTARTNAAA